MSKQSRTESIKWNGVLCSMPDAETTLLIYVSGASEPVWIGYWDDGLDGSWRYADGSRVEGIVTHWAEMPEGPKE